MANLVILVQTCDNGRPLFTASIQDNHGNIASLDKDGAFVSTIAYVGYRLTASAPGYEPKEHIVTDQDLERGTVVICLDSAPQQPNGGGSGICSFNTLAGPGVRTDHPAATPNLLRRVRHTLRGTALGAEVVAVYEDEAFAQRFEEVVSAEPLIGIEVLALILHGLPVLQALGGESRAIDARMLVVDGELAERSLNLVGQLRERLGEVGSRLDVVEKVLRQSACRPMNEVLRLLDEPDDA